MRKISIVVALSAAAVTACGTVKPDIAQVQSANFGPAPSNEAILAAVRAQEASRLKDPYSALYECRAPRRAWTNVFGKITYGWAVACTVNAKNSFGAYVGVQPRGYLFQGDVIVQDAWANIGFVD